MVGPLFQPGSGRRHLQRAVMAAHAGQVETIHVIGMQMLYCACRFRLDWCGGYHGWLNGDFESVPKVSIVVRRVRQRSWVGRRRWLALIQRKRGGVAATEFVVLVCTKKHKCTDECW